jgi:hypothetical protein
MPLCPHVGGIKGVMVKAKVLAKEVAIFGKMTLI